MLTRENKIGLVLAFLLGLSDLAILGALAEGGDQPPVWVVVISVVIGLATVVLVVLAWRAPTWPVMVAIIAMRALSGLGDLMGIGQNPAVTTISLVLLLFSVLCIALLRNWIRRPAESGHRRTRAGAVG
jgi:phosphatidylglycerophosphate synthase